ncbi:type II toxin-antitoxin system RelE/ParE family toxin [Enterococcus sp. 669A]|uniref:Type II toxin-antitoxin system RelE/ParE family toxin n=1 Tax=Candidatus Enterococcus moelleringii TaxID=2815325 RepID=A0ABS3L6W5_9ENTE|nr:type II toxin-antitoxin system RelE/ParE family toxin [Enterococcus sp. 669A]MBO1305364.1 type II toxin-antitoxin system RelE/ParE family toxin [Enterococcus sp. 669A]
MEKLVFHIIKRKDGTSEFMDFVESLPLKDAEKLLATIDQTEEFGLLIVQKMEWGKKLETDLYELRSKVGSNIQRAIYFQKVGNEYFITHGFTKKSQKTPRKEIEHAKKLGNCTRKGNCSDYC